MNKETVIATLRAELTLSGPFHDFLERFNGDDNAWFAREGGNLFLAEFGPVWNSNFVEIAQSVVSEYFVQAGLPDGQIPKVTLTDSRRGSWFMEAAIVMYGTVGTAYTILKGVAELPKIADGLEDTKKKLQKELSERFKKEVPKRIEPVISRSAVAVPLPNVVVSAPVSVTCSIDARPLRNLTPDVAKSHSIHLSVAVSRSALSLENLGDTPIENLRIGLFKSKSERHSWSFADAFSKVVPRLSAKQSISLSIQDFSLALNGSQLDLSDDADLHVDCWVQDNTGIYLFNFFLEHGKS